MNILRFFGTKMNAFSDSGRASNKLPLERLRKSLQTLLHDCKDMHTQRVIYKINAAQTPGELWLLRSDLHQCIAKAHSQSEAAARINSLIAVFEGWVPASQLTPI
jgi:hypothetical protein